MTESAKWKGIAERHAQTREHLRELIEKAEAESLPDNAYSQPPRAEVKDAEEEFEWVRYDLDDVPWGAIAMRGNELRQLREE
jgi:hypothetical protein